MHDFARAALEHLLNVFIPTLGKVLFTVLAYLFVGPAELYHLVAIAVILDTLTGLYKARVQGKLQSHSLRVMLMSKLTSYTVAVSGAGLLHNSALHLGIDGDLTLFAVKFTLVSIVVIEVLSMWENISAVTGMQSPAKKAFAKFLEQFVEEEETEGR